MSFIAIRVRTALVVHGYDAANKEILEHVKDEAFVEKIIAVSRIQSVSEKYVLVTSSHGRVMYWEYEEGMQELKARLEKANLLVP
jgi:hypothetical protein